MKDKIVAEDNPEHRRRSVRLKGFDYARAGAYFVTVCVQRRRNLFGEIVDGTMRLNEWGQIAEQCWREIPDHFEHVELDASIVMPNHVHGIIVIGVGPEMGDEGGGGAAHVGARYIVPVQFGKPISGSLATIVRCYKAAVSRRIHAISETPGMVVWHENYYEHIIRNDRDWNRVRAYIRDNPERWDEDEENPLRMD